MRKGKVYALYKGDHFLADGTIREISEKTGKTINHLRFMTKPAYKRRCKSGGNCQFMVLLDE